MKRIFRVLGVFMILASLGGLWGCGAGIRRAAAPAAPMTLTVLHVNDTHSHLEPVPSSVSLKGEKTYLDMGGFARLAAKARQVRSQSENVLLLHGGDAVQGTLYFTRFLGEADFAFLNRIGFDVMAIGNHEFDKGPRVLSSFFGMSDFPMVSANVDAAADPYLRDLVAGFTIKDLPGGRVGIVGLTLPETAFISSPGKTVRFNDIVTTARTMIGMLIREGVDKIIFLTHLGYETDQQLARSVSGIDLIVGGHSHSLLGDVGDLGMVSEGPYPTTVRSPDGADVHIVQDWEWAKTVGVFTATFDERGVVTAFTGHPVLMVGEAFRRKDAAGRTVPVDEETRADILATIAATPVIEVVAEDAEATAMLARYKPGVDEIGRAVIGVAAEDLLHVRIPGQHPSGIPLPHGSHIAPVVCEAMAWKARDVGLGVDLVMLNGGGVRTDVPAGDITVGMAYTLLPFGSTLVVMDLPGAVITAALESGLETALSGSSDGAFPYLGRARYTADLSQPSGRRITGFEIRDNAGSWTAVDPARTYRLGVNSYMAGGGDGYTRLRDAAGYRYDTGFVDAEIFVDYFKYLGTIDRPADTGVRLTGRL
jgi:5'-nucleotidase